VPGRSSLTGGRPGDLDHEQYLYLTTRGRKSGKPREIEIWFTHREGTFFVIAEYMTSQWVQNIKCDPVVQVKVGGTTFAAHARILSNEQDAELLRLVQELSRAKYGWGDGLPVELTPD
jgi:deazaflavin-dependent oxidoreductase (nitroreductase family)